MTKNWKDWNNTQVSNINEVLYKNNRKLRKNVKIEIKEKDFIDREDIVNRVSSRLIYVAQGIATNNPNGFNEFSFELVHKANAWDCQAINVFLNGDYICKLYGALVDGYHVVAINLPHVKIKDRRYKGFDSHTIINRDLDLTISKSLASMTPLKMDQRIAQVKSLISNSFSSGSPCYNLRKTLTDVSAPLHAFRSGKKAKDGSYYYDENLLVDIISALFFHWAKEDNLDIPWEIALETDKDSLQELKLFLAPIDRIDFLTRKIRWEQSVDIYKAMMSTGYWVQINNKGYTYVYDVDSLSKPSDQFVITSHGKWSVSETIPTKIRETFEMFKVVGAGTYVENIGVMFLDDPNGSGTIMFVESI
jgi:hypothetical protein